ncbi:MAG TPA: hypothetical protein VFY47_02780, partial [Thermoleophilaceae bacterium]|nr:hypothetical protein [Thermoleophilaceae bacterium]
MAIVAFALGAMLGNDPAPEPRPAETLSLKQLAGERIVTGLGGTSISPALRAAIREGKVAGIVLFAANFPSRAAGRRLVDRLQGIPRPAKLRDPLLIMV